jgi:hypothetical protein
LPVELPDVVPAVLPPLAELLMVVVDVCWLRATDETHIPWLLTDGLCGFVAVQLLRATEETMEPWFPLP